MNQYTFTDEQLCSLLQDTIEMFQEHVHEQDPGRAAASAANEAIEGLIAERELFNHGELTADQLTQVYPPKSPSVEQVIGTVSAGSSVTGMVIGQLG